MSPSRCAPHPVGQGSVKTKVSMAGSWSRQQMIVLEHRDLCALRTLELDPILREIPLKKRNVETTERHQVGLALEDTDDSLPSDSWEGRCLDEGLHISDDPILESGMSSEGNQVLVNSHKTCWRTSSDFSRLQSSLVAPC